MVRHIQSGAIERWKYRELGGEMVLRAIAPMAVWLAQVPRQRAAGGSRATRLAEALLAEARRQGIYRNPQRWGPEFTAWREIALSSTWEIGYRGPGLIITPIGKAQEGPHIWAVDEALPAPSLQNSSPEAL